MKIETKTKWAEWIEKAKSRTAEILRVVEALDSEWKDGRCESLFWKQLTFQSAGASDTVCMHEVLQRGRKSRVLVHYWLMHAHVKELMVVKGNKKKIPNDKNQREREREREITEITEILFSTPHLKGCISTINFILQCTHIIQVADAGMLQMSEAEAKP